MREGEVSGASGGLGYGRGRTITVYTPLPTARNQ